jgi:hypothetical protein
MMKPRHAAALALVGWYLMSPPIGRYDPNHPEKTPLNLWKIDGPYDTAIACVRAKTELTDNLLAIGSGLTEANSSQCIATDDPRLKGN